MIEQNPDIRTLSEFVGLRENYEKKMLFNDKVQEDKENYNSHFCRYFVNIILLILSILWTMALSQPSIEFWCQDYYHK
jgi:hypothetical protein